MPNIPDVKDLKANSVDIVNAIRSEASPQYQAAVPILENNYQSLKAVGESITRYPGIANEFIDTLVNRIGRVILTSKMYRNPWAIFKQGYLEFGETVEEIFTNLAKPNDYDPEVAETQVFKRVKPDIRAAFHVINYTKFYKATIQNDQLRQAFLSWDGVERLIASIVDSMYTGAAYDEFLAMKYLLARRIIQGNMYVSSVPAATKANAEDVMITIKGISNLLEFPSANYNESGVTNSAPKNDQYLIINSKFDAVMDVAVLAAAFNMSKAEFLGHRILVDSFGALDTARLQELLGNNPGFQLPTKDQLQMLDNIPAVLVDRDYFMVFDALEQFTENYNGQGLYWNYFYHTWKILSVSPFANAIAFVGGTPTVTAITINPATASLSKGASLQFYANVTTTNFAPTGVNWTIDSQLSTIAPDGMLTIGPNETATSITVTATSVFDSSVAATATVTVA